MFTTSRDTYTYVVLQPPAPSLSEARRHSSDDGGRGCSESGQRPARERDRRVYPFCDSQCLPLPLVRPLHLLSTPSRLRVGGTLQLVCHASAGCPHDFFFPRRSEVGRHAPLVNATSARRRDSSGSEYLREARSSLSRLTLLARALCPLHLCPNSPFSLSFFPLKIRQPTSFFLCRGGSARAVSFSIAVCPVARQGVSSLTRPSISIPASSMCPRFLLDTAVHLHSCVVYVSASQENMEPGERSQQRRCHIVDRGRSHLHRVAA